MNFGSKKVYVYSLSDEESVSGDSETDNEESTSFIFSKISPHTTNRSAPTPSTMSERTAQNGNRASSTKRKIVKKRAASKKRVASKSPPAKKQKTCSSEPVRRSARLGTRREPITDGGQARGASNGRSAPIFSAAGAKGVAQQQRRQKVRRADGNVFTFDVGSHAKPGDNIHVNTQRITCPSCQGVVTAFSSFQVGETRRSNSWTCEFCSTQNNVKNEPYWVKPTSDDVTFELEAPPVTSSGQEKGENYNVVFAIDTSGSMKRGEMTSECYVTRLEAVKKAALHQIKQIKDETPNVGVGFVTFGSEITIFGEITRCVRTLQRQQEEAIGDSELACYQHPLRPIKDSYDDLTTYLSRVSANGPTPLGPALMTSVSLAGNIKGSKVIICTDGHANRGIGSLPWFGANEQEISDCRKKYKNFGEFAKKKGVSVSVISFEGTDCKLVHLGLVADMTGGVVDIVSLSNVNQQFGNILTSRTVATDVTVRVCLHQSLYIRNRDPTDQSSTMIEQIGNVDADTDLVVEFGIKTSANDNEIPITIEEEDAQATRRTRRKTSRAATGTDNASSVHQSQDDLSQLPFQTQITFTSRDGGKYLRVITNLQQTTRDREEAEDDMDMNILGAVASKSISKAVLNTDAKIVRSDVKAKKKMVARYVTKAKKSPISSSKQLLDDADDYVQDLTELDQLVRQQQCTTKSLFRAYQTDQKQTKSFRQQQHSMSDRSAKELYNRSSKGKKCYATKKAARKR